MIKRALVILCISILSSIAGVEVLLRTLDPLGAVYFENSNTYFDATIPDETGYALVPGSTYLKGWSFSILNDGTRITPDISEGKRVVFVGDSITFGLGVNDEDAWVYKVCADLKIRCVNAGRAGYAASNVADVASQYPAACVVFLTISNDDEARARYSEKRYTPYPSAIAENMSWLFVRRNYSIFVRKDKGSFSEAMSRLEHRLDTLILAFDDGTYGNAAAKQYGAVLIPDYISRISVLDPHPDAEGNRQIAEAITPVIEQWLSTRSCQ
jgi:lysophospholipase L1-like esterase